MEKWLKTDSKPLPTDTNLPPFESETTLACLSNLPPDAINYKIQIQFVTLPTPQKPRSKSELLQKHNELISQLKTHVFAWFPTNQTPFETVVQPRGGGWAPLYCDYKEYSFATESGVRVRAQLLSPKNKFETAPLLIYSKRSGDSIYSSDFDELLPLLGRFNVLILYPRFTELSITAAEYTDIERTSAWIGRTIAGMQIWDIMRTIEWALREERLSPVSISLFGKEDMGILSLYAALFDERVQTVILSDAPASHWQHPALLNVLRVTDIPQVAAAFAPRRLVSLTDYSKPFDYTRNIYKLAGASSSMSRSTSLPEAVEVWKFPAR